MRFSHIDICSITLPLPLLQLLQNLYCYFHTTLLLNTLLQILSLSGVVELTTQMLILKNIIWLPLYRINKFGLNTLTLKTIVTPYTCGLSVGVRAALAATFTCLLASRARMPPCNVTCEISWRLGRPGTTRF